MRRKSARRQVLEAKREAVMLQHRVDSLEEQVDRLRRSNLRTFAWTKRLNVEKDVFTFTLDARVGQEKYRIQQDLPLMQLECVEDRGALVAFVREKMARELAIEVCKTALGMPVVDEGRTCY